METSRQTSGVGRTDSLRHAPEPPCAEGPAAGQPSPARRLPAHALLEGLSLLPRHVATPQEPRPRLVPEPPPGGPGRMPPGMSVARRTGEGRNQPVVSEAARHLGTLDERGFFAGTGKWNGAQAPLGAPPSRTEPLLRHEAQQVGYQLAAKLNDVPIDDPDDRRRLVDANQTVYSTRVLLRHGRGNVPRDIAATGGASLYRTAVVTEVWRTYGADTAVGAALVYGSGSCDIHAHLNSRLHVPKLRAGEQTFTVGIDARRMAWSGGPTGHAFSEARAPHRDAWRKQRDGTVRKVRVPAPAIVMDSWASGPAIRRTDSAYQPHAGALETSERFDRRTGALAVSRMKANKAYFSPGGVGHAETEGLLHGLQSAHISFVAWNDVQVVSPGFARLARDRLARTGRFTFEIMAAGTAREAYGLSVAAATSPATLQDIRREVAGLDRQARPEVCVPPDHAGPSRTA